MQIAHGIDRTVADRIWITCAAAIAIAIVVGMCGGRIAAL